MRNVATPIMFIVALNGMMLAPRPAIAQEAAKSTETKIGYIRPNIPNFEIPPLRGRHYEDTVPDTIDIAERARLAINCLTEATNPDWDYDIFFWVHFFTGYGHGDPYRNPPVMRADCSSWCHMKFAEALPLLRLITGSDQNNHVDRVWMESILKSIGPDGLFYWPLVGKPYYRRGYAWMSTGIWREDGTSLPLGDERITQFTHPLAGRYIGAMTIYYLRDDNPIFKNGVWRKTIERMIDRWAELAIDKGDYAYYPAAGYAPGAKVPRDLDMPMNITGEECNNRLIQGLAQYYRVNRYEPAKELAGKLVNFMRYRINWFDDEARWIDGPADVFEIDFFHAYTITLLSMLDYAMATGDQELLEFVHSGFRYGLEQTVVPSSTLIGWFPENLRPNYPSCELCGIADMIALALKLTDAGLADYLDDVDRWTRNMFIEGQLTETDWVYRLASEEPETPVREFETAERAIERNLGAFSGWITPNEWVVRNGIMHCCTGNAARTLYTIWEHMLDYEDGRLRVNFLMNRASRWADIHSHVPYEGRVDVKVKKSCDQVLVRVPQWIATGSGEISASRNESRVELEWDGRYLKCGPVAKGETLTVRFPISERTVAERIGGKDYTFIIRGSDVVSVDPPGRDHPLFQREHYRSGKTRFHKVTRFASDETIRW